MLVDDPVRGALVLVGGADAQAVRAETWIRKGGVWRPAGPGGPGPRTFPAAAFDRRRGRLVLFGGNRVLFGPEKARDTLLDDTWEWDGAAWKRLPVSGPPERSESGACFDERRGRVVLQLQRSRTGYEDDVHFYGLGQGGGAQLDRLGTSRVFWNSQVGHGPGVDFGVPLVVLTSPYRLLLAPLLEYVDHLLALGENHMVTIVIPEFIPARWWQQLLHNQTALLIKGALLFRRNVVVTDVPYHLMRYQ